MMLPLQLFVNHPGFKMVHLLPIIGKTKPDRLQFRPDYALNDIWSTL